jgi:PEP-CTERM motif
VVVNDYRPRRLMRIDTRGSMGHINADGLYATEWSALSVINLGLLPGSVVSQAYSINESEEAVGFSLGDGPISTPEPSTWAMMLVGFAGLGFAGYRASRRTALIT